jgi:di/tricarboxylate transporter
MTSALLLVLLIVVMVLLATEWLTVDVTVIVLLLTLIFSGILTPKEAFSGFSNEAVVILAAIFIISGTLQETGVLDGLASRFVKFGQKKEGLLTGCLMGFVGSVSAFMNNTTVTAMFLSPTVTIARRCNLSSSRLLLPLAFASILGGTCTLIGTSTNVAVSGYIAHAGMRPLGMFELTPIGVPIFLIGLVYMVIIGRHLLPRHEPESLTERYAMREYLSEIRVLRNSPLVLQPANDSDLSILDFTVLKVIRGKDEHLPSKDFLFAPDDRVVVAGRVDDLLKVKQIEGLEIASDRRIGDAELRGENIGISEVVLTPQCDFVGSTLSQARFRQRHDLTVLAVARHGRSVHGPIGRIPLHVGDCLLVQGGVSRIEQLRADPSFAVTTRLQEFPPSRRRGYTALALFALALAGALLFPPLTAGFLLAAAVAMILFRCIDPSRIYEFVDWRLLVLIAGMTAFGLALEKTGTAQLLAEWVTTMFSPLGAIGILTGFILLTVILTQPMSNAAAALVVLPVAIATARQLGSDPRSFAIAIMLAASASFITPFEPSCILVYGPGRYKFFDFIKVGFGLTVLMVIVLVVLVPIYWPL